MAKERIIELGEASSVKLNSDYIMIDSATRGTRKILLNNMALEKSATYVTQRAFNVVNSSTSTITITEGE